MISKEFGFTPQEIDEMDVDMLNAYVIIENELAKQDKKKERAFKNKQALRKM